MTAYLKIRLFLEMGLRSHLASSTMLKVGAGQVNFAAQIHADANPYTQICLEHKGNVVIFHSYLLSV